MNRLQCAYHFEHNTLSKPQALKVRSLQVLEEKAFGFQNEEWDSGKMILCKLLRMRDEVSNIEMLKFEG